MRLAMKNKLYYLRAKKKSIPKCPEEMDLPDFLVAKRKELGVNRNLLANAYDVPYHTLYTLEHGLFRRLKNFKIISRIAKCYHVSPKVIQKKMEKFLEEGKGLVQNTAVKGR
jgi:hypothetical protein